MRRAGVFLREDAGEIAVLPLHADGTAIDVFAIRAELDLAARCHRGIAGGDVERRQRLAHLLRIGRACALQRIGDHVGLRHQAAGIFEQEIAGALLVFGVHLLRVVVHVVIPVRYALQAFGELADVLVEVRNDETAGTAVDRDVEADLLHRAHDQNEIVEIRHREQRIGAGGLDFVDQRARIGEAGGVGLEHHDLDAFARRKLLQSVRGRGAKGGVLEDHRDLGLLADQLRHLQLRFGKLRGAGEWREGVGAALVELVGTRAGDDRHLGALANFARDQGQRAGEAAMNGRELVAGDQTVGLGARHRGVALHVGSDEVELGAAERLDAAGLIDHLDRQLGGSDAADADLRHAAGGRIESADIDGVGGPAA